ncbi:uncharacterized protein LOC123515644 [Portunus trituberculatus]|uniref:uncharacterized protein LOC123515644 n=1 Tax=Portunus trituberculatus TaxID=210409 RepID=UPI001E1CCA7A|nr:uncharacterized protein LOC123515644 [Portunus trituberculatus]
MDINGEVQDYVQVEVNSNESTSLASDGHETKMSPPPPHADHTYTMASIPSTPAAEPVDAAVQVEVGTHAAIKIHLRAMTRDIILTDDGSVRFYTGLPSKDTLVTIFDIIKKRVTTINYWRGAKYASKGVHCHGPSGHMKIIDHFDEYLLTLVYMRRGFTRHSLSDFFGVSQRTITCITTTWISVLFEIMKNWLLWPSAQEVRNSLPKNFPPQYADTRVILDCTEFYHVKPKNCTAQASTYSQYKHQNTVKVMIGITPRGLITFVSQPYGGNTSDRHIAEKEILDKVEPGDAVMVNRGFNIGDLLLQRGAKLYIPFTRKTEDGKGRALNQSEILKTREITSLRIHVERAIQRMKTFRILTKKMSFNLWPLLHQILFIIAFFCNLQPPLLKH